LLFGSKISLKLVKIKKYVKNLTVKSVFDYFDQLKGPGFPKNKASKLGKIVYF